MSENETCYSYSLKRKRVIVTSLLVASCYPALPHLFYYPLLVLRDTL